MMKKLVLGCCLIFVLSDGECWGMNRSKSDPVLPTTDGMVGGSRADRPSSAPVTKNEMQEAINKWSHLVPNNATTVRINKTLQEVITHIESPESKQKMEALVELICNPGYRSTYANYVHMVFIDALPDSNDEERNKFGGMLAGIANSRGGTSSLFWDWYAKGYFDSRLPMVTEEDESLE